MHAAPTVAFSVDPIRDGKPHQRNDPRSIFTGAAAQCCANLHEIWLPVFNQDEDAPAHQHCLPWEFVVLPACWLEANCINHNNTELNYRQLLLLLLQHPGHGQPSRALGRRQKGGKRRQYVINILMLQMNTLVKLSIVCKKIRNDRLCSYVINIKKWSWLLAFYCDRCKILIKKHKILK